MTIPDTVHEKSFDQIKGSLINYLKILHDNWADVWWRVPRMQDDLPGWRTGNSSRLGSLIYRTEISVNDHVEEVTFSLTIDRDQQRSYLLLTGTFPQFPGRSLRITLESGIAGDREFKQTQFSFTAIEAFSQALVILLYKTYWTEG